MKVSLTMAQAADISSLMNKFHRVAQYAQPNVEQAERFVERVMEIAKVSWDEEKI